MTPKENTITRGRGVRAFLRDVERLAVKTGEKMLGANPLFPVDVQMLDGFKVGYMEPQLFRSLCSKHGLPHECSEAILMQANLPTEPHVHLRGESTFLPLGEKHGFTDSEGGTFMGDYQEGQTRFALKRIPAKPGRLFRVPAGKIHYFAPGEGGTFSAVAFVSPKIKQTGGLDIERFGETAVDRRGDKATVTRKKHRRV